MDKSIKECDFMAVIKERIIGAVTLMTDKDAENFWELIKSHYIISPKTWEDIEEGPPDEFDLAMLKEIENDPDCQEFVSSDDVIRELGLS